MVQDPSGAVIPAAQIIVTNQDTGTIVAQVKSTQAGAFAVPFLAPGSYRVEVTAPGFKTFDARDVAVRVTEITNLVAKLQVGAPTQMVTVEAKASEILVSTPTMGETITAHTVENLPLSNRNFFALLSLSAGTGTEFFDSTALGRGQVTLNVNGQRPANNNYQLEGINANDLNLPILDNVALPNPDTIGEFKTQTSLYDASQGRNGGGDIQVGLRHGTSSYHGDVYEFFRDRSLNANDFFLNRQGQRKPQLHQNEFGASFGGPVPKLKDAFFFGNYQGWRESSGLASGTQFSTQIPAFPASRTEASLEAAFFPNGLPPGFTGLDPVALAFLNLPASKCPVFNDGTFCIPSLPGTPGLNSAGKANLATISRASLGTFRQPVHDHRRQSGQFKRPVVGQLLQLNKYQHTTLRCPLHTSLYRTASRIKRFCEIWMDPHSFADFRESVSSRLQSLLFCPNPNRSHCFERCGCDTRKFQPISCGVSYPCDRRRLLAGHRGQR
jgi:hypothetical protein